MDNKALIVAVSDYSNLPGENRSLTGPGNDADRWRVVLERSGYDVVTLRDAHATKATFIDTAQAMAVVPDTNNVIIFSGHGTRLSLPGHAVADGLVLFKPAEVDATNYLNYVVFDFELPDLLNNIVSGTRVTLIFDCCYGAAAVFVPEVAAAQAAEGSVGRPRFIALPGAAPNTAPPRSPFAATAAAEPEEVLAAAADLTATKKEPQREFTIDGHRYILAPDPPVALPLLPNRPVAQFIPVFRSFAEPMVIAASGIDQEAFEVDDLNGGKPFGLFSFFATRELDRTPTLNATTLCERVNVSINGRRGGQQANTPTRSGREADSFLSLS